MTKPENLLDNHLIHRSLKIAPHLVQKAKGAYLYMPNGKVVLDGCGGSAVVSVGHGNEKVIDRLSEQLSKVSYVHTLDYTTTAAEELGNLYLEGYEDRISKVYFSNSGSEAIESAIKLALQYFHEQGRTSKNLFISRNVSYHGNTLGALALSGHVDRREPFTGVLSESFHKVSPAFEYRYKKENETTAEYVEKLAKELEDKILELGPENVAGFAAETVVGATSGCTTAPEGYFEKVRSICDKYDVLLILDEVMCGSGRTGTYFAWEQEGVVPDITVCGKALSSGYSPLSAIFFTEKIVDVLRKGSSAFNNRQTFQAYPLSCAAGIAVREVIKEENLLENVKIMGQYLREKLEVSLASCPIVGDIRGRGLFVGIEFVSEKSTKQPFPAAENLGSQIHKKIWENGVAVYPGHGTIDGVNGDHILIAPPFNVSKKEIDIIVEAVTRGIFQFQENLL